MTDQCCLIFNALGDKTRLEILKHLKKGELCVSDICTKFNITQPSVSHHLDILKRAGLVKSEKRGREVYYSFLPDTMINCCGIALGALAIMIKKI